MTSLANQPSMDANVEQVVVAGRYRIEERLASGGMGEVLRVFDLATSRRVALKRLIAGQQTATGASMLEREYHTLAGLAHPHIVRVFDYGLTGGTPFYTMELLDGRDLRELAPMSYSAACRHLYDIASSLALLHARRLLHRDVSPRNVRLTDEGRCKLIDFGALTGFGVSDMLVGTPPFIAPEALHGGPLDQRVDLFALGALAYWVLTGHHAYSAARLAQLPECWKTQPQRPGVLVDAHIASGRPLDPIPAALDELVLALLTLERLGRPSTAAEVMDRLLSIAGLEADQETRSSRSYLRSPALVARGRECGRLEQLAVHALTKHTGGCIWIESAPGMGATRLLGEIALRVQLAGVMPIVVSAKLQRRPYGIVHDLIDKIFQTVPVEAAASLGAHAGVLAGFSERIGRTTTPAIEPVAAPAAPGELRSRTQHALFEWLLDLAKRRPLALFVDDLNYADEGSLALLASLSRVASSHALAVFVVHQPLQLEAAPSALKALSANAKRLQLGPLGIADVRALVRSLFGDVEHVGRLCDWLFALSVGNPRACMELVEHLVDADELRYADGTWILPQELPKLPQHHSLDDIFKLSRARLSEPGARLAEALSVHHGALSLVHAVNFAGGEQVPDVFAALEELVREGVLLQVKDGYQFSHESQRQQLLAAVRPERRRLLHARLGALLCQDVPANTHSALDAGWHFLQGGEETRGAELLARAGLTLEAEIDEYAAAVAPLRAALTTFRKQGRPDHELVTLLCPLVFAGYYYDRRLADEFGWETIGRLRKLAGLGVAAMLRPLLGPRLSLYVGLLSGLLRAVWPGGGGARGFVFSLQQLIRCSGLLVGVSAICFRLDDARRFAAVIEPLRALGSNHAASLAYEFGAQLAIMLEDRMAESTAGFTRILARLDDPRPIRGLRKIARQALANGCLMALGALEVMRGGHKAIEYAQRLEATGTRLYLMVADQVRASYHAMRGESVLARRFRERVEINAVQMGSNWQAEVWVPYSKLLEQAEYGDRVGLKRTAATLERMAVDLPSLERPARLARAAYYTFCGDHERSIALRQSVFDAAAVRGYIGWQAGIALQAQSLHALGRSDEAKALLERAIATWSPGDRQVVLITHRLLVILATVHAEQGELEIAEQLLDATLREFADCDAPLALGNLHHARAQVALLANEYELAEQHLVRMKAHFEPSGNPHLIAKCEQLRRALARRGAATSGSLRAGSMESREAELALRQCPDRSLRAQRALALLLLHCGATHGVLFGVENDNARVLARTSSEEPSTRLLERVEAAIGRRDDEDVTQAVDANAETPEVERTEGDENYLLIVLHGDADVSPAHVGVAAIAREPKGPLQVPAPRVLRVIANAIASREA